ncbi:hypothetical protein [Candidatus Similichlamydia laticola]|uniref:Uncharacterized protein n=1 Tax=Candidatus Similichlamydia laticola TaxID=2170265 RepID=A0A369KCQ7_9BACT|nr:hypothetical protein [Candidatus Similichlamydia laticola]RDB31240.1 hypothetical protein HAT2_00657 [Candidatus Similichlamydia laticola]
MTTPPGSNHNTSRSSPSGSPSMPRRGLDSPPPADVVVTFFASGSAQTSSPQPLPPQGGSDEEHTVRLLSRGTVLTNAHIEEQRTRRLTVACVAICLICGLFVALIIVLILATVCLVRTFQSGTLSIPYCIGQAAFLLICFVTGLLIAISAIRLARTEGQAELTTSIRRLLTAITSMCFVLLVLLLGACIERIDCIFYFVMCYILVLLEFLAYIVLLMERIGITVDGLSNF